MAEKFFMDCCIGGRTKIQPGDALTVLSDNRSGNLLFARDGTAAISIMPEAGGKLPYPEGKAWSREHVRYLAAFISAISGLAIEETETPNPVFNGVNVDFRFV